MSSNMRILMLSILPTPHINASKYIHPFSPPLEKCKQTPLTIYATLRFKGSIETCLLGGEYL